MNPPASIKPAIFLDRDGTIIDDLGHLSDICQVHFLPGVFDALRKLQVHYKLFIVTNQSGIAKGLITGDDADRINQYVCDILAQNEIEITETYTCPHNRTDNCECIKPNPYFLHQAQEEYGIDLKSSFVIGDHPHDVDFATEVGATGLYVLTGHGIKHKPELPPDTQIFNDLPAAVKHILNQE